MHDAARVKEYFRRSPDVAKYWEPEGDSPSRTMRQYAKFYRRQREIAIEAVPENARLALDCGTGKGRFAIQLAANCDVVAVDLSPDMIREARRRSEASDRSSRVMFVVSDAENLPLREAMFDVAFCMETLVHVPNPKPTIRELRRVTRPAGRVILNVTSSGVLWRLRYRDFSLTSILFWHVAVPLYWSVLLSPIRNWIQKRRYGHPVSRPVYRPFARHYAKGEFRRLIEDAGLRIIGFRGIGPKSSPVFYLAACSA